MKKPHLLTDPPRRRRFITEQKASILAEVAEGMTVAEAALVPSSSVSDQPSTLADS